MDKKIKVINKFFTDCRTLALIKKKDKRGAFTRIHDLNILSNIIPKKFNIVQISCSQNIKKGTFRGFHFQVHPFAED